MKVANMFFDWVRKSAISQLVDVQFEWNKVHDLAKKSVFKTVNVSILFLFDQNLYKKTHFLSRFAQSSLLINDDVCPHPPICTTIL